MLTLISLLLVLPVLAHEVAGDTTVDHASILNDLQTKCYDVYKPQYDSARATLPTVALLDINIAEIENIPNSIRTSIGLTEEGLAELPQVATEAKMFIAPYAQQSYLDLAQMNIDLATCYSEHLANDLSLRINAEQLRQQAQDRYDAIASYDFVQAFTSTATGSTTLLVPAHNSKTVRLRTYCLDTGRGVPTAGEIYYLAASVDELQTAGICALLQSAETLTDISNVQAEIWSNINTTPKASGEITPASAQSTWKLMAMIVVSSIVLIGSGLLGVKRVVPKPVWIVSAVVAAGVIAAGSIAIATKTVSASSLTDNAVVRSARSGDIVVQAVSTGSFSALDVTITNLTATDLTLDTSCLTFIPQHGGEFQRLGSDDIINNTPPPLPLDLPLPEETLDVDELIKEFEKKLPEAESAFVDTPNEDTLKNLIEKIQKCQLLGCEGADDATATTAAAWKKALDQTVDTYKNNPFNIHRQELQRATEIGQMLGSDTAAAVELLLNTMPL